ncbi:BTB/POZ protein [Jimgerdemannia flammicorona]|uniref:BTB/POZ protein n=2 Tax=Jimgerdemannia flammicorona TaxID=994334 RepID=A0A433QPA4_9FUNG|nr:BTB/POZ protein [Jimgerdemannia flammicorona]RUS31589.1 BTB/POZ protein [Jimgerdemannia flammicorona]
MLVAIQSVKYTFECKLADFAKLEKGKHLSDIFWTSEIHPWRLSLYPVRTMHLRCVGRHARNDGRMEENPNNFSLVISQHGHHKSSDDFVSCFLVALHTDPGKKLFWPRKNVFYRIFFTVEGTEIATTKTTDADFVKPGGSWGFLAIVPRKLLLERCYENTCISVNVDLDIQSYPTLPLNATLNLAPLLDDKDSANVEIHVENRTIHAHQSLLVSRSHYFAALFGSGMRETAAHPKTGRAAVTITDFPHHVVLAMLRYLYAGTLDFDPPVTLRELFTVADKYDVRDLRNAAHDGIVANLSPRNVLPQLFKFAHRYTSLKRACLDFVRDRFIEIRKCGAFEAIVEQAHEFDEFAALMGEIVRVIPTREEEGYNEGNGTEEEGDGPGNSMDEN